MRHITESEVRARLSFAQAIHVLREAFLQHGRGEAQVMPRQRIAALDEGVPVALSAMGAILAASGELPGVMGTKVYSTRPEGYRFLVNLFDAGTGAPLATLEANEFTRIRTAAASGVAVDLLARHDARRLALFGAGIQARAHAQALAPLRHFEEVLVCARTGAANFAAEVQAMTGRRARVVDADTAAREGDVIACCTRSPTPLFDGALVRPGSLVVAVGTSLPTARELDDTLLARAALIAVEWRVAACQEAGELALAAPGVVPPERLRELGELLLAPPALGPQDLVVYKSVGIGLEDVALARHVACA